MQAQDLRAARLALRARGAASAPGDVDAALGADGSLVVAWLMRGTLHLVAREDHAWLLALTAGQNAATIRRRLGQLGVSDAEAERAVAVVERALAGGGPARRGRSSPSGCGPRDSPPRARPCRTCSRSPPAAARSCSARSRDGGHAFALARDWLGRARPSPDRDAALAELARRYLRGHGPAGAADLAAWSGLGLRDARAGLAAIAGELEQTGDLVDLAGRSRPPGRVPPRLLGAFDPYLLGWRERSFAVDPAHARRVHPGGGIVRATAIADGRAVATWTMRSGRVALDPFAPLPPALDAALRREAERVARFA